MSEGLAAALQQRQEEHLYRHRRVMESPQGVEVVIDGRRCLSFCSNDYLGLASHPQIIAAFKQGADRWGVGSGASHLVTGHSAAHHALEEELAALTDRPRALLFSTGYMANLGTVTALTGRGDQLFEDRLNHASLIDAGRLSGARLRRYHHADTTSLATLLAIPTDGKKMVISDGVFSMDGDLAPVAELVETSRRTGAWLMIDDAHGFGVFGARGGGILEHLGINSDQVPVLVGTLGKACGTFGAFVAGSEALIETLIQKSRTYLYTTALPSAVVEATRTSLQLIEKEPWRREHLHKLIARFRNGASQLGLTLLPSHSPIQPFIVGESEQAVALSETLLRQGILVVPIRPPTVPKGSARLRFTLSAAHSEAQVDRLLDALDKAVERPA